MLKPQWRFTLVEIPARNGHPGKFVVLAVVGISDVARVKNELNARYGAWRVIQEFVD